MPRLRKAYLVEYRHRDDFDIVYAPTPAKAKGSRLWVFLDCGWSAFDALQCMSVRRSPANDVLLPDEHRLVAELGPEERRIILHAYGTCGGGRKPEGYRNHYCTDPSDRRLLRLSWELGIFSGPFGEGAYGEVPGWVGAFFYLTTLGKEIARSMLPTYPQEG